MCGIAGFINYSESIPKSEGESILNRMMTQIQYRGPDDYGLYVDQEVCMGNVRLSIIDLAGGLQPLSNEDGSKWIVYNGEIYNYPELRSDLIKRGHKFKTRCDTEVIIHMYEEYGPGALNLLNGQFAFAIWDSRKKECFFARDRVGVRPLFYSTVNNTFIFGSEIKSIFEFPGVERRFMPAALKEVFTFWTTLSPNTIFDGIYELPSGHYALYKEGHLKVVQYWSLKFAANPSSDEDNFGEAIAHFKYLLSDSVSLRLRSDVQVGAFLSGGLDSSVITSLIRSTSSGQLNTYSIRFDHDAYDESRYQDEVSQYFQTNHKSYLCSVNDIAETFPEAVWHSESPLLRTAPVPFMGLSKLVHENGIKVIMTGEGADEAFAGYNIFKETLIRQFWARQPESKIRPLLLKKLYPYITSLNQVNPGILRMFFGYKLELTSSPVYSHLVRWRNTSNIQNHFMPELIEHLKAYDPVEFYAEMIRSEVEGISSLAKAQLIETNLFMSGYLLSSQGDRMTMAHSVEGRYPFLDHRILEFAASMPDTYKLKGMDEKFILKEMMKNELPQSVLKRKKQAYRAPISEAFIGSKVPDYIRDILAPDQLKRCGIFNPKSVSTLLNKLKTNEIHSEIDDMALAGILSTQILYNQFVNEFMRAKRKEVLKGNIRNKVEIS